MDFILLSIVVLLFVALFIMVLYLYNAFQQNAYTLLALTQLVQRTFQEYYKGQDMEINIIGNGVDLVWTGDVKGLRNEENDKGFITIYTVDSGINSPINDIDEADILASKITPIIYDYIKDKDGKL